MTSNMILRRHKDIVQRRSVLLALSKDGGQLLAYSLSYNTHKRSLHHLLSTHYRPNNKQLTIETLCVQYIKINVPLRIDD